MDKRKFLMVLMAAAAPVLANQSRGEQTCDTASYPLSSPDERYTDNGDGTVTDKSSGLMWMRCALGQSWTGKTCGGEPSTFTWQSAQSAASRLNTDGGYASHADWRMPHIPELAMIVERQCANPRINLSVFPATPSSYFWTATGRRGKGMDAEGYLLSFGADGAGHDTKDDLHFARLVRAGK